MTQMNVQLKKACRNKGITGISKMNKKTLIKTLAMNMGDLYDFKEYNDILYLILIYIPKSSWCKISQVSKTYNKVIREIGFSPWYCVCPRCELLIHRGEFDIKKDISSQPIYKNQKDFISVLKSKLNVSCHTVEYAIKVVQFYDIFCSIAQNIHIIKNGKLKDAIFQKLLEMQNCIYSDILRQKMSNIIGNNFMEILSPFLIRKE